MGEFLKTADSRETSVKIMQAILSVAGGDEESAVRIWEEPTNEEAIAIWERVTKNGLIDASEFCWGIAGSRWAADLGIVASVTVRADEENAAETFFDFARSADDTPDEILQLAQGGQPVEVTSQRAGELRAWCESAEGWADGPEYARYALLFE